MPEITFEKFVTRFKLIGLDDGPIDTDEMPPGIPEAYIWTAVDGGCQEYEIVSGYQRMDRVGYWLCRVPTDGKECGVLKDPDDVAADARADAEAPLSGVRRRLDPGSGRDSYGPSPSFLGAGRSHSSHTVGSDFAPAA